MNASKSTVSKYRWFVIFSSFIIMMIIIIYQYSWFLFAFAIEKQFNWNAATIGMTFKGDGVHLPWQ